MNKEIKLCCRYKTPSGAWRSSDTLLETAQVTLVHPFPLEQIKAV